MAFFGFDLPSPETLAAIGAVFVGVGTILAILTLPKRFKPYRPIPVIIIGYGSVLALAPVYEGAELGLSPYWLVLGLLALLALVLLVLGRTRWRPVVENEDRDDDKDEDHRKGKTGCSPSRDRGKRSHGWTTRNQLRQGPGFVPLIGASCLGVVALLVLAATALTTDQLTAIGTLALAVFSAATIWSSRSQTKATREATEATQLSANATLREAKAIAQQVGVGQTQVEASEKQNRAAQRQVEIARRSLEAQSVPQLIPAGSEYCRFSNEHGDGGPGRQRFGAVYLGVVNAGNGAAVIDAEQSRAGDGVELTGPGQLNIVLPPALASGADGEIKLTPATAQAIEPKAGMTFKVEIAYSAFADEGPTRTMSFTAQFFSHDHWLIKVTQT